MSKLGKSVAAGTGMLVVGAAMYVVFGFLIDFEIPFLGLRQIGAVVAVLGVIELVATWWTARREKEKTTFDG